MSPDSRRFAHILTFAAALAAFLSVPAAEALVPGPQNAQPQRVSEDVIDLARFHGSVVTLRGMVVRIDSTDTGSTIVLGRRGGAINISIPVRPTASDFPAIGVGDDIIATGVLLATDSGPLPELRLAVTTPGRVVPAPTIIEEINWTRWGILAGAGALMLALLMFAWRGLMTVRERPFRSGFDQAGGAMMITDRNLKVIEANKAACRLLSRSITQLKFKKLPQLVAVADGADTQQIVANLRRGQRSTVGAAVRTGEGFTDVDITFSRVRAGRREYVGVVLHDVSKHTDSVNQFKQFHEALLDGMPVEVGVLSPSGKYLYANGLGFEVDDTRDWVIGKTDIELCRRIGLGPDIALRRRAHRRRAITSRKTVQFEELLEFTEANRHVLRMYHPVFDEPGGEVVAVASYGTDITQLKESLRELDAARTEADKVGRLKESFLENINEEFRSPISGIIGFAEILESEVPETQREFVNLIERNGRRLMNTLNAVLDLAGLNNNDFDLSPQVLNIVDEVRSVVDGCRDMIEEKGLFLRMESSRPEILARADQVCLSRVVQNLIDNAVKFTEAGGVVVEVDADDTFTHVRVLDSGSGIDAQGARELFSEVSSTRETSPFIEGVGIGLGITKRLVELMRGRISVESQVDEGSVFAISIPRAFPARGRFGAGLPRLLVADASSDARTMIEYVLESRMFVRGVADVEAIDLEIRRMLYDVILVDVAGLQSDRLSELIEDIRDRYNEKTAPIVAVDAKEMSQRADEMRTLGFDAYLAKPFKKQALLSDISAILLESRPAPNTVADEEEEALPLRKTG